VTKQKIEISVLVGLVVVGGLLFFFNRNQAGGVTGVSAAAKFVPLSVQEPQLRLDLLARLQKESSSTLHRNIFTATPPPPPPTPAQVAAERATKMVGPPIPPPPQPVHVPGEFFGYAFRPPPGKHFGFFKDGDEVLVVAEGDTFLSNYRLLHIGTDSADVEEISSGRQTRVTMTQPATAGSSGAGAPGDPGSQQ
jgi:hypothetical protein